MSEFLSENFQFLGMKFSIYARIWIGYFRNASGICSSPTTAYLSDFPDQNSRECVNTDHDTLFLNV